VRSSGQRFGDETSGGLLFEKVEMMHWLRA
jgi:hypothetical protein